MNDDWQRTLWRSRRGMLELDILLVGFAGQRYPLLAESDQRAYRALLEHDDWLIWEWLQRLAAPPAPQARIVELIVAHHAAGGGCR